MRDASFQLIINADDLGLTESVNDSILDGWCHGLITSASLMVNMPRAEDALEKWTRRKNEFRYGAGLGIHLSLTSGPAALPQTDGLLTAEDGTFRSGFAGLARSLFSFRHTTFLDRVAKELNAQLDRADDLAQRFGVTFDHLDSHQHVHVLPGIGPLIEKLAAQRQLVLRIPSERYGSWQRFRRSLRLRFPAGVAKKMILDHFAVRSFKERPAVGYFGIIDTGHMNLSSILAILEVIPRVAEQTGLTMFEINLHPWNHELVDGESLVCSNDDRRFACLPGRSEEKNAVLEKDVLLERMEQLGIKLVGLFRKGIK